MSTPRVAPDSLPSDTYSVGRVISPGLLINNTLPFISTTFKPLNSLFPPLSLPTSFAFWHCGLLDRYPPPLHSEELDQFVNTTTHHQAS